MLCEPDPRFDLVRQAARLCDLAGEDPRPRERVPERPEILRELCAREPPPPVPGRKRDPREEVEACGGEASDRLTSEPGEECVLELRRQRVGEPPAGVRDNQRPKRSGWRFATARPTISPQARTIGVI
jgi:hypothetical protein